MIFQIEGPLLYVLWLILATVIVALINCSIDHLHSGITNCIKN